MLYFFIFLIGFHALLFLWYALKPRPAKTYYKQGKKILMLGFVLAAQSVCGQLYVSPKQIRQDGNDLLIEIPLKVILTGDSVVLHRALVRTSYPLKSVRRKPKGVVVRFGDSQKLVLLFEKRRIFDSTPDGAFLVLDNWHYYLIF